LEEAAVPVTGTLCVRRIDLKGLLCGAGEGGTNDGGVWMGMSAWDARSSDEATEDGSTARGTTGTVAAAAAAAAADGAFAGEVAPRDALRAGGVGDEEGCGGGARVPRGERGR
jgi:hypothetical protein